MENKSSGSFQKDFLSVELMFIHQIKRYFIFRIPVKTPLIYYAHEMYVCLK